MFNNHIFNSLFVGIYMRIYQGERETLNYELDALYIPFISIEKGEMDVRLFSRHIARRAINFARKTEAVSEKRLSVAIQIKRNPRGLAAILGRLKNCIKSCAPWG